MVMKFIVNLIISFFFLKRADVKVFNREVVNLYSGEEKIFLPDTNLKKGSIQTLIFFEKKRLFARNVKIGGENLKYIEVNDEIVVSGDYPLTLDVLNRLTKIIYTSDANFIISGELSSPCFFSDTKKPILIKTNFPQLVSLNLKPGEKTPEYVRALRDIIVSGIFKN